MMTFLSGLGSVKKLRLHLSTEYAEILCKAKVSMPMKLPSKCHLIGLKTLILSLDYNHGVLATLVSCLLNSSTNIENLRIIEDFGLFFKRKANHPLPLSEEFWKERISARGVERHLSSVTYHTNSLFEGGPGGLCQFLVKKARVLKRMSIQYRPSSKVNPEDGAKLEAAVRSKLLGWPRASPDVLLEVPAACELVVDASPIQFGGCTVDLERSADTDNRYRREPRSMVHLAVSDYPLEHWSRDDIHAAFQLAGNVTEIAPANLAGYDFSSLRVILAVHEVAEVPSELWLTSPGGAGAIAQVEVLGSWDYALQFDEDGFYIPFFQPPPSPAPMGGGPPTYTPPNIPPRSPAPPARRDAANQYHHPPNPYTQVAAAIQISSPLNLFPLPRLPPFPIIITDPADDPAPVEIVAVVAKARPVSRRARRALAAPSQHSERLAVKEPAKFVDMTSRAVQLTTVPFASVAVMESCHAICLKAVRYKAKVWARERYVRNLCQERLQLALRELAAYWKQRGKVRQLREGDANTDLAPLYTERFRVDTAALDAPFTSTEAITAIHAMNKSSTPGPDGFGAVFYQSGRVDLERVNQAYVVLIPKRPGATTADAHRPICLQNCGVKIASKILTSRLQILSARGFLDKWKGWITDLLTSSKSAVLVNGCPGPWFSCKRGLRQDDLLSSYLFIIVADVLQALIKADGAFRHPLAADQSCPVLQYADDTLILLLADIEQVSCLKRLLDLFSEATGLHINFGKSTVVPMHVDDDMVQECVGLLGCRQEGFLQTYLGLPLSNEKLNMAAMAPLFCRSDRLSRVAAEEIDELRTLLDGTALGNGEDVRCSDLFALDGSLQTTALYRLVPLATSPDCNFYKFVWKCRVPQRVRFFGWLMVQGRIQCKSNLLKKNIVDDDNYDVCGATGEDTDHIMFGCSFTRSFWMAIGVGLPPNPSVSRPWELQWPSFVPTKHQDTLAMLCH
ncbi:hypothetical protein PR202_ga15544 [Eleusine coracana subsp. coracana]|uniref:Reverse transcriptase zinc-binding domain-containing protein n=1 Tax=Eleusine coracana subsp. coracana TaxID=191504 RepID=A0AAV5CKG9_ELECO|nr:hypothetical protein PR202_ga15544 [Eleusine coracana subsp. coracana]